MAIFITSQTVNGTSKLIYLYTQFLSLNKVLLKFILYIIANITLAPSPVSAPLYTLANFTCEGIGDVLLWTVEDSSLGNPSNQHREISVTTTSNVSLGILSSVLTIRALPINDGISVGCLVASNNFDFVSKGTTLEVEG